ncbi:ROK family protein [Candidatus Saccharibacteria bacterium]|nr:ROK family protein [Candidatus Saccharibacteria bacterium]
MYLTIDIGGTKTLIALFSKRGRVIRRVKFKTPYGKERFIRDLVKNLQGFTNRKIVAIAMAIPGTVYKNYSVSFGNRDWGRVDLLAPIKKMFSCPIYLENDANLAAIYESTGVPGKTVFLTFSTGIGGGVARQGKLLAGTDEFEPGHKKYEYNGKKAEWEDIAGASAIEKAYHVDVATDLRRKTIMMDIAQRISLGLPDIIASYRPQNIILGGPMGKIFKRYVKYLPKLGVKFRRPKRPLESVIYGCYLYAKQQERG